MTRSPSSDTRSAWRRAAAAAILGAAVALPAAATFGPVSVLAAEPGAPPKLELRPGVWLEVVELRRLPEKAKGIVALKFAIDNQSGEGTSLANLGLSDNGRRVSNLKLIDFQAGKDYWIGSSGGDCLCSTFKDGAPVGPGQRQEFWAWFGAPPAGVGKLAVFVPGAPPLFDVPLGG
jgi:hypothetical protein